MANSGKSLIGMGGAALLGAFIASIPGVTASPQMPPPIAPDGTQYLPVNINPTTVPPMVNINPNGAVPEIDVNRMPELAIRPTGCESAVNFESAIGTDVTGPIVLTFLSLDETVEATLEAGEGPARIQLGAAALATAIYLAPGQRLAFTGSVLYSGCRPG